MLEWIYLHKTYIWWLGTLSVVTFIVTLIVIPILVVRIPAGYFTEDNSKPILSSRQLSFFPLLSIIIKNLFGIIFILAGFSMLLLTGQGFISILIGIMLINFPGKRTLERRIVQQAFVLHTINWIRARANRPPLKMPRRVIAVNNNAEKG
jgi:hypothetical protein